MYSYNLSPRGAENLTKTTGSFWDEIISNKRTRSTSHYFMTPEEIGKLLGITRERVRQIEAKAIRKLQFHKRKINFEQFR